MKGSNHAILDRFFPHFARAPVTSRSNPSRVPGLSGTATPPYSGVSSDPWDNTGFILYLFVIELTRGQQIRAIYYPFQSTQAKVS